MHKAEQGRGRFGNETVWPQTDLIGSGPSPAVWSGAAQTQHKRGTSVRFFGPVYSWLRRQTALGSGRGLNVRMAGQRQNETTSLSRAFAFGMSAAAMRTGNFAYIRESQASGLFTIRWLRGKPLKTAEGARQVVWR